jgi:hypothetical protein
MSEVQSTNSNAVLIVTNVTELKADEPIETNNVATLKEVEPRANDEKNHAQEDVVVEDLKEPKAQGTKRKRECDEDADNGDESTHEHDNEEQEEQEEEDQEEQDDGKEPARKKQRFSKQEIRAKRKLYASPGQVYKITEQDVSDKVLRKVEKGSSYEQKLVNKRQELKEWTAATKNISLELQKVFAEAAGPQRVERATSAAIALGNALAANDKAHLEAQRRGLPNQDLVPRSELQKLRQRCIVGTYPASNGWQYTFRMKPGKLPSATKKFLIKAMADLLLDRKLISYESTLVSDWEYLIDTMYSQSYRAKFRQAPEGIMDCKLPKVKETAEELKAQAEEEPEEPEKTDDDDHQNAIL